MTADSDPREALVAAIVAKVREVERRVPGSFDLADARALLEGVTLSTPGGPWVDADGRRWDVEPRPANPVLNLPDLGLAHIRKHAITAILRPVPDVAREAPEGDAERCQQGVPGGGTCNEPLPCEWHDDPPPAAPAATTCDGSGEVWSDSERAARYCPGCPSCRPEAGEGQ